MAAAAEREPDLDLGIDSIDAEHRDLVRLFDAFARAIKTGAPIEQAHAIVAEALAVANAHFEHEEELAEETGYPLLEDHKFRHRHMRMQIASLVGDAMRIDTDDPVTLQNLYAMRRMVEEHIEGPDRELAEHLKAAGFR